MLVHQKPFSPIIITIIKHTAPAYWDISFACSSNRYPIYQFGDEWSLWIDPSLALRAFLLCSVIHAISRYALLLHLSFCGKYQFSFVARF